MAIFQTGAQKKIENEGWPDAAMNKIKLGGLLFETEIA